MRPHPNTNSADHRVSSAPVNPRERNRFWLHVAGATATIMLGCWLCSGTVAPYGTYDYGDCHYRMNGDHYQFTAVYAMLDGEPSVTWGYSVVLRRILHPLLAFPLIKLFGFDAGAIIFNILLHGASMIAVALAFRRFFDARAAVLTCWLLATYPGYAYWAGVPYSYAMIVPGSIACTIGLLWWNDRPTVLRSVIAACIVGFVGLGYDLMPYFGGALLLLILYKRRWLDLPVALVVLGGWALFVAVGIPTLFGFSATNTNTQSYGVIVKTWLHFWQHTDGWLALLRDVPHIFISNFFFSAGIFLPILFLLILAHHVRYRVRPIVGPVALAILLAVFGVFLFLNLAPPYVNTAPPYFNDWQLRGTWIARLYQPWFVVVLLVVAAASVALRETPRYKLLVRSVVVCCVAGWLAIAGPYIHFLPAYKAVHHNFYQAFAHRRSSFWMFKKLGVRPYGFCKS